MQRYLSILSSPPPGYRQARKKSGAAAGPARKSVADFPPDQSVGYLVRETHRAFLRALGTRVSRHGVSTGMWYFLRALWEEDGLTQRELSRRVRMMEPTTATALESMERRGLISRTRNRLIPRNVLIQSAVPSRLGLAERPMLLALRGEPISYEPHPDDPAELLGIVVYAMGPA